MPRSAYEGSNQANSKQSKNGNEQHGVRHSFQTFMGGRGLQKSPHQQNHRVLEGSRLEVGAAPATKSVRGLVIKTLVNRHGVRD